jgi:O-antigen ligase
VTPLAPLLAQSAIKSDRLGLVFALFALLLPVLGLLADKAVVILVIATAVAGGLAAARTIGWGALPWRIVDRGLALALAAVAAWCLVRSLWSFAPLAAAALALRVTVLLAVLLYLVALAGLLPAAQRRRVAVAFCIGFAATLMLLVVELVFVTPLLDLLQGPADDVYHALSRLNRGVSTLAILVWPLAALGWAAGQRLPALLAPAVVLAPIAFSQSSASILGLAAALPAALLAALGRPAARLVMAVAVIVTLFGSPFIAQVAQQLGVARSEQLQETAKVRLHVWHVVSTRIAERPLFGWGFDASPTLPTGDFEPFRAGEKVIPSHPHNGALQIMVETGLVGSLLVLALLVLVARRIDRLAAAPRACAVAMLVTILGVAATGYGITQSHWLAVIGAAAAVFLAVRQDTPRS